MARGMNHIFLIGCFARDPEARYTASGLAVFEGVVAGQEQIIDHTGVHRNIPFYHRVSMLGKAAEWQIERNYKAGSPVMVEGSLEYNSWEVDGQKRSTVKVKASRIEGLDIEHEPITDSGGGLRMNGGLNEAIVIGNLTRDPELRYTPNNSDAVLSVALAVNESYTDRQGNKQDKVHWLDATFWREIAESMQHIKKGDPIFIKGRLINESWTDREGNKRNAIKIEATKVEVLSRGGNSTGDFSTSLTTHSQVTSRVDESIGNHSDDFNIMQDLEDNQPEVEQNQEENIPF